MSVTLIEPEKTQGMPSGETELWFTDPTAQGPSVLITQEQGRPCLRILNADYVELVGSSAGLRKFAEALLEGCAYYDRMKRKKQMIGWMKATPPKVKRGGK